MDPYIKLYSFLFMLLAVFLLYVLIYRKGKHFSFDATDKNYALVAALVIFAFVMFRDETVGTDTTTYVAFFKHKNFYYHDKPTDLFFEYIGRFLHLFSGSVPYFIAATGLISLYGIHFMISRLSKFRLMSWILFSISGTSSIVLFLYLSMIRQSMAMTLFFVAVWVLFQSRYPKKKKLIYFGAIYASSVLIHGTVLFTAPFIYYFYRRGALKNKTWYLLLGISYALAAKNISFVSAILGFVFGNFLGGNKYENYSDVNFGGIEANGLFNMNLIPFMAISIVLLWWTSKEERNKWYMQFLFLATFLNNIFFDNLMWSRLILYFAIFMIIALPNGLRTMKVWKQIPIYSIFIAYYIYKTASQLIAQLAIDATGNIVVPYNSWLLDSFLY